MARRFLRDWDVNVSADTEDDVYKVSQIHHGMKRR